MSCVACTLTPGAAVGIKDYGGACDECGFPVHLPNIIGMYVRDIIDGSGFKKHVFWIPTARFTCEGCGHEVEHIAVYCGGPLDVTAEMTQAKVPIDRT